MSGRHAAVDPWSIEQAAQRVAAQVAGPYDEDGDEDDGDAAVPAPGRWAHLPGGGRGLEQPRSARRIKVAVQRLVKPVAIFGFVGAAIVGSWGLVPGLVHGAGSGLLQRPAVSNSQRPSPAGHVHGARTVHRDHAAGRVAHRHAGPK